MSPFTWRRGHCARKQVSVVNQSRLAPIGLRITGVIDAYVIETNIQR